MLFLSASGYEAAIPYFSRVRNVTASSPERQNYFVVDTDIWKFARPDLVDLRLYDAQAQVPYALIKQSGGRFTEDRPARILNLGKTAGGTEFDIEVGGVAEYDRVRLVPDAKNFIDSLRIQG